MDSAFFTSARGILISFSLISKSFYFSIFFLLIYFTVEAQSCSSPYTDVSSSVSPFTNCTGVVEINGVFTIDANYTVPAGVTELRISGSAAKILFTDDYTLTLSSSALLSIISGATIESLNCNDQQRIEIGMASASCSGETSDHDFSDVQAGKGFNQSGLPVELSYFDGVLKEQSTQLTWQTSTELNNAKFIIETSPLGEVFQPLGEVAGAGTTTEPQNYSFTHHTPSAGINYYRLKQVDFDGTFEYSKVIAIEAAGSQDIFAFPNPARDKVILQYDQSKGAGNIQLLDALGRRINANIAGYAGNYEVVLPESLARGTYWLKVERNGKVQTLPVVKE